MKDAFRLLRIPFSVFLMPVFWFALGSLWLFQPALYPLSLDFIGRIIAVFVLIHLFLYPASNGYNSYFDRDEGSIGGLKHPPKVTKKLFWLVAAFDGVALLGSLLLSPTFAAMMLAYTLVSKAYSWDTIRLKRYPIISTVVVTLFQGAFTYYMVQVGVLDLAAWQSLYTPQNLLFAMVSTLFLLGSYPLTQVYQHAEDSKRGDRTLSLVLGISGTFTFAALMLGIGAGAYVALSFQHALWGRIAIFMVFSSIILAYFGRWVWAVHRNPAAADFDHSMQMNKISSLCMSAAFIATLLWEAI
jgi:4-hydroxybenzoate polyprenyltransferase